MAAVFHLGVWGPATAVRLLALWKVVLQIITDLCYLIEVLDLSCDTGQRIMPHMVSIIKNKWLT